MTVFIRGGTSFLLMYICFICNIWALKTIKEHTLCNGGLFGGAGERHNYPLATNWHTLIIAA
ncbi:hypothetical protein, partial [Enterobacter asburiae]